MNYYNKISKGYNELYKEEQLKKLSIIENNIKINKNDLLLDVGCGTGISSQLNCKVIGIDNSIELLKLNKNKILSNAENLPFKDNIFDIVISMTALHNFADIESSLKEIKRVGKNKFVFSVLKKSKKINQIKRLIEKYFKMDKIIKEDKDILFFIKNKNYINNYNLKNKMENEKVRELAESLKKQGLAASMYEAMEKAKNIIGEENIEKKEEQKEKLKQEPQIKIEEQKQEKEGFFEKLKDKITHKEQKDTKRFEQPNYDIAKEEGSVNELMKELGIDPDKVKEMEKEKLEKEEKVKSIKEEFDESEEEQ